MREPVPVIKAITLYERFRSWAKVAALLRRRDGTRFTIYGIWAAVRRYDRRPA